MKFYAGSKTFLVGEYSVLFGGTCILLITPPYFELTVITGKTALTGISRKSQAYKLYNNHKDIFRGLAINFKDPHKRTGGWGASSAQYSLLYKLYLKLNGNLFEVNKFLNEYRYLSDNNSILPSGADCLAQYENQSIYYNSCNRYYEPIKWHFKNLDFYIFKTKKKIITHEHLKTINNLKADELKYYSSEVYKAMKSANENDFCKNLQLFFWALEKLKLVVTETSNLVRLILKLKGVKAAKGCGALSADTILVVFEKKYKKQLIESINNLIQKY